MASSPCHHNMFMGFDVFFNLPEIHRTVLDNAGGFFVFFACDT